MITQFAGSVQFQSKICGYVLNKLLIAHKSRLLFTYNDDSIRDKTSIGNLRTFSESIVFRRNDRGVLIGRTLNLNCCTQQANCNSGLPAPYYY